MNNITVQNTEAIVAAIKTKFNFIEIVETDKFDDPYFCEKSYQVGYISSTPLQVATEGGLDFYFSINIMPKITEFIKNKTKLYLRTIYNKEYTVSLIEYRVLDNE